MHSDIKHVLLAFCCDWLDFFLLDIDVSDFNVRRETIQKEISTLKDERLARVKELLFLEVPSSIPTLLFLQNRLDISF